MCSLNCQKDTYIYFCPQKCFEDVIYTRNKKDNFVEIRKINLLYIHSVSNIYKKYLKEVN